MNLRPDAPASRTRLTIYRVIFGQNISSRKAVFGRRPARAAARRIGPIVRRISASNARAPLAKDNLQTEIATATTKRVLQLILEEAENIELMRVPLDDDAAGAVAFNAGIFKGKAK